MADARFLLRPRWLLSHLLVVLLIVVMVNLGFWQLRRLDERRERNDLIRDRQDQPAVPVADLLAPDDGADAVSEARFRPVTATGTYDDEATVAVRNRTQDGVPGGWLVTPVVLDDGSQVPIVRGFVGLGDDSEPDAVPAPEGELTVTGVVINPAGLDRLARRDTEELLDQPATVPALVLQAEGSETAEGLTAVPLPELTEGPHLSYAVQWFIFSTIALVGYPLVLRRVVRRRGKEVDDPHGPDDLDRELAELLGPGESTP